MIKKNNRVLLSHCSFVNTFHLSPLKFDWNQTVKNLVNLNDLGLIPCRGLDFRCGHNVQKNPGITRSFIKLVNVKTGTHLESEEECVELHCHVFNTPYEFVIRYTVNFIFIKHCDACLFEMLHFFT